MGGGRLITLPYRRKKRGLSWLTMVLLLLFHCWWLVVCMCKIKNDCCKEKMPVWVVAEGASTDQELLVQGHGWCCLGLTGL